MPCRTDYMDDPPARPNMENYVERSTYKIVKAEADETTRMLCSIFRTLDEQNYDGIKNVLFSNIEGLDKWWHKHQEEDARRLRLELQQKIPNLSVEQLKKILDGDI